jgi:hypothetical protein
VVFLIDGHNFTVPKGKKGLDFEQQFVHDGRKTATCKIDAGIMACTLPKA